MFFFFFQAEDGIRDGTVTGVQTCALPICRPGQVLRAGLVTKVLRQLQRDAGAVAEVHPDGGEDGDGGEHEEQGDASVLDWSGAHDQKSRGDVSSRRDWVDQVRSLPCSSMTVMATRTRGGTRVPPVRWGELESHSSRHSRSRGSHACTVKRSTSSASTALAPPRSGSSSICALTRRNKEFLPASSRSRRYSNTAWSDSFASTCSRWCAKEVTVMMASLRPSLRRKNVGRSRNRLRS